MNCCPVNCWVPQQLKRDAAAVIMLIRGCGCSSGFIHLGKAHLAALLPNSSLFCRAFRAFAPTASAQQNGTLQIAELLVGTLLTNPLCQANRKTSWGMRQQQQLWPMPPASSPM